MGYLAGGAPDRRREHGHDRRRWTHDRIQHRPDRLPARLRGTVGRASCRRQGCHARGRRRRGPGGRVRPVRSRRCERCVVNDKTARAGAEALVQALASVFRGRARSARRLDPSAALSSGRGVVNATPVGMLGIPGNPIPLDAIARHPLGRRRDLHPARDRADQDRSRQGRRASWAAPACACTRPQRRSSSSPGLTADVGRMQRTFAEAAADS